MHPRMILKVLGLLLMLFSLSMLPPVWVDIYFQETTRVPFFLSFLTIFVAGLVIWIPTRKEDQELRHRDGFLIAVVFWSALCFSGAIPFMLSASPEICFIDALFESVSGITSTGATIFSDLEILPHAILYYRQQLQFLGGLGILMLAVAILPMLGVGGMQLFQMDSTGPIKDQKLTPRITETAKVLWLIYVLATEICILAYWCAGMSVFDAICYGFGTMSTGGFAPHNNGLAHFESPFIYIIACFFMLFASISFPLHFMVLCRKKLRLYWQDEECKRYLLLLVGAFIFICMTLAIQQRGAWIENMAQLISFATTTGFEFTNYSLLPGCLPIFLLFLGIIGGCAESTTGGIKMVRLLLLEKQGIREINRLIHPQAKFIIRLGKIAIPSHVVQAIWGFLAIYIALFGVCCLLIMMVEPDFLTVYSTVTSTLSNTGPALGNAYGHYGNLHPFSKIVLSFSMLAGRLEIFTVIVFFSPAFWKR